MPLFIQLNYGWNAEPNAPGPIIELSGPDLILRFFVNPFQFKLFKEEDVGVLRFYNCARYRLGPTNDEGWYRGQCRYRSYAPTWGEFYELAGDDPHLDEPLDWSTVHGRSAADRHYLFYLRDHTFECMASSWAFEPDRSNALFRVLGRAVDP